MCYYVCGRVLASLLVILLRCYLLGFISNLMFVPGGVEICDTFLHSCHPCVKRQINKRSITILFNQSFV